MRIFQRVVSLGFIVCLLCANGCGSPPPAVPPPATPATGPKNEVTRIEPKVLKDEAGPDNSRIKVKQLENGQQVEVRTWASGPIEKLTRREGKQKGKVVKVIFRDGKAVRVEDPETVEHAFDWPAAQLSAAAKKLGKPVEGKDEMADDGDEAGAGK